MWDKIKSVFTKSVQDTSGTGTINSVDVAKLLKDTLLVAGAAVTTFLLAQLGHFDFGQYGVAVVPVVTFLLNLAHKFFKDNAPAS